MTLLYRLDSWRKVFLLGAPWLFLFLQAIPHSAALRSLDLVWLLCAALWMVVKRELRGDVRSPLTQALSGLTVIALCCAMLGVSPADSIDAVRKEFLAPILAFLILVSDGNARRVLLVVTTAVVAGFLLRTILVTTEWSMIQLPQRLDATWVKGYAMEAVLFLPLLLASLLLLAHQRWLRAGLAAVLVLQLVIVVEYGSRTALAALLLGGVAIPVILGYWRVALLTVGAAIVVVTASLQFNSEARAHYESALEAESFAGTGGMSGRYPIWHGMVQIIAARPLLGYGPGWKKLPGVAREGGFLERWQSGSEMDQAAAVYFQNEPGSTNPHNVVLQVLFEVGALGLVATLALWAAFGWTVFQSWRLRRTSSIHLWLAAAGVAFLMAYGLMNFSNGLWPLPGPVAGLLAVAELSRRARLAPTG